ncbi:hypothetical protein [Aquimarina celericrescens]|uniref:Tail fiber domain-containing protein n=1 Tax=Aquimarina celericrescens TaxID=1964542 RepID=A0ABW5AXT1_9FLAO|nr:hypothetical protein [Aquimarina celericrescens]
MKKLVLTFLFLNLTFGLYSQKVFVPNGLIGNSLRSNRVGIGTEEPNAMLEVNKIPFSYTEWLLRLSEDTHDLTFKKRGESFEIRSSKDGTIGIVNSNLFITSNQLQIGKGLYYSLDESFVLGVNGKTITEEVHVQPVAAWPDYVFENDYDLISLPELEEYVKENKHLPEIPTAEEVSGETGFALGEMNTKLLKKVEELTLYVIQLHKRIEELENKNK